MKKEKYLLGLLSHLIWVFVGDMKDSCILQRSQSIKVVNQDPCSKYNVVGTLLLLGIKSRKKFEVWNFLQVCIRSFRSEMSPRHTVLKNLMIYPVVILVLWFHWHIFPLQLNIQVVKWNHKTRVTGLLWLKCMFHQHRQFSTAVTACWYRRKMRRMDII